MIQYHKDLIKGWTLEESYDCLAAAVNEMSGDCTDKCDRYGHAEDCPACDTHHTLEQQQKCIAELRAQNERQRGLLSWAAGRLLDAGDVEGHEKVLAALEDKK